MHMCNKCGVGVLHSPKYFLDNYLSADTAWEHS
jgi:hypothetical protein